MNVIQTFYGFNKENPINNSAGFLSPEFNWMSMALSCLLLKNHFGKVTLYCNQSVKNVIVEMGIPYDHIELIPDFMDSYSPTLWALPKIYTYSKQSSPFLHVDCDWFMFDRISNEILNSDLIAQNIEYDDQLYHKNAINKLIEQGVLFPNQVKEDILSSNILSVANAGIFGGNDVDFFKEYLSLVSNFIQNNLDTLEKVENQIVNSVYEQYFFYVLSNHSKKKISCCTPGDKLSSTFNWMQMDFINTKKSGYMHLIANFKRRIDALKFVSNYLEQVAPVLHNNIVQKCRQAGISLTLRYYDLHSKSNCPSRTNEVHEYYRRTIHLLNLHNIIFDSDTICNLEFLVKQNDNIDGLKNVFDFEKLKTESTYYLLNNLYEFKQIQNTNLRKMLHIDPEVFIESEFKISINNLVKYIQIKTENLELYINGQTVPSKRIMEESTVILAIIPDPQLARVCEIFLFGLNMSIFNIIKNSDGLPIKDIVGAIFDSYFDSTMDLAKKKLIKERISLVILAGVQNNIYNIL